MKKWEDIVKEMVEEPDKTLPESVFEEFRARRNGEMVPVSKPHIRGWVMIPAVAAGLAVALFLLKPSESVDSIQIVDVPVSPVTEIATPDSTEFSGNVQDNRVAACASTVKDVVLPAQESQEPEAEMTRVSEPVDESTAVNTVNGEPAPEQTGTAMSSPFAPQGPEAKTVNDIRILPAVGAVAGGSLLAALLLSNNNGTPNTVKWSEPGEFYYLSASSPSQDILTATTTHHFPIRVFFSTRIPISNKLGITTGLDYSLYSSNFTCSVFGVKKQLAHYVGLPVRLDWIPFSNRWLDIYVGGGIEGDFCVAATMDGNSIEKDGFSMSLLGVGGIQFNASKRFGIFVEPQISWTVPSEYRVLTTYRTAHSLMFSVAGGIRINIGK